MGWQLASGLNKEHPERGHCRVDDYEQANFESIAFTILATLFGLVCT